MTKKKKRNSIIIIFIHAVKKTYLKKSTGHSPLFNTQLVCSHIINTLIIPK